MALTEDLIKHHTTAAAFRKGKQLVSQNAVEDLLIERDEQEQIQYLNGKVSGNVEPYYNVSVDYDEKRQEITATHCECEAYRSIPGYCKHIVALSLVAIEQEKKQEKENYPVVNDFIEFLEDVEKIQRKQKSETKEQKLRRLLGIGTVKKGMEVPKQQSDTTILKMLDRLAKNVQDQVYYGIESQEKIEIEPHLYRENGYGSLCVSFRIGGKKKYVLKSLEEFVELMESREYFSYGKNLSFVHARENFVQTSLPLLDFIIGYVNLKGKGQRRSFYYGPATKEILLNGLLFEQLFLAIEASAELRGAQWNGMSYETILGATKGENFYLQRKNPELELQLEKTEGGAYLEFPEMQIMLGTTEIFIVDHNMIYHCKEGFCKDLRIILEQLDKGRMQSLFIADEDLQSVCASIMPKLSKYFRVREKFIAIEEYQPPEAEIFMYLDDDKEIGVTCRVECQYGSQKYRIFETTDSSVYRDIAKEAACIQLLERYFVQARRKYSDFMILEEDKLYELLAEGIDELNEIGHVFATEEFKKNSIRQTPSVDLGVSIQSNLLDLSVQSEQLPYAELDSILNSYKLRKRYHRLKDGQFLELEDSSLSVLSELADGLELTEKELKKGTIRLPKHRALFIDAVLRDAGEQVHVHRNQLFKELIRNIKNVEDSDYEIPAQQYPVLRSYQKKGYRWLRTIREYGFGGILADDMGLGKTLQMITLFQAVKEEWQQQGKKENTILALVVCPASLVYNWESEIAKFAPTLTTQIISGTAGARKQLIQEGKSKDVWITSYDLLKRDYEQYQECYFDIHVIDEAQYIKNASTQAAKAVKSISSNTRIALTGTPIENRLSELWSIFDFLMPGLLFSYKHFKEEIETAIVNGTNKDGQPDTKASIRLKNMVRPFILRRLKEDVLKDLPKKMEHVVYAKMEGEQQKLYDARVQMLKQSLENQTDEQFKNNKIQILSELTRLRQICCDPLLCYEDYKGASAKLSLCMEMIADAVESGHKMLIFSQFTTMLDRIGKELEKEKISYYKLTGATKKEQRIEMANDFNENEVPVFLISLRAGGTGLNLVGADMVIHFDPWWNLAAQNQATDRAHRIGQKRAVTVFKMIAAQSIEEKILALQEKKKDLADQIISDEGMSEGRFTREDLLEIL